MNGDIEAGSISVALPFGTDVTSLLATFETRGIAVAVQGVEQTSGLSSNDFTSPVTYTVSAQDGTTEDYAAYVHLVPATASVPSGADFAMGYLDVAMPVHIVESVSAFRLGTFEITYEQWYSVRNWATANGYSIQSPGGEGNDGDMGVPPTTSRNEPVIHVSWQDCLAWCNALSEKEGLTPVYYHPGMPHTTDHVYRDSPAAAGLSASDVEWSADGYRLPTEAEWEYAARYIDGVSFVQGDRPSGALAHGQEATYAWHDANSGGDTQAVGLKTANALGIFDMSGNAGEFCWDWFREYSTTTPYTDPDTRGPPSGIYRTYRGGEFYQAAEFMATSYRGACVTDSAGGGGSGLRVARRP